MLPRLFIGPTPTAGMEDLEGSVQHAATVASRKVRRPWLCFILATFGAVVFTTGTGPMLALLRRPKPLQMVRARAQVPAKPTRVLSASSLPPKRSMDPSPPPPKHLQAVAAVAVPTCGNGKCEPGETITSCFADCPGVTTAAMCSEEPHMDPQGHAVVDGRGHHKASAGECCEACAAHAADPRHASKPCNSWVFCYMPICWSMDTGNTHTFGECWLKWQADASHPLYGQRGRYSDAFRKRNWNKHRHNNLTVPTHVPWTGGVLSSRVDLSIKWETQEDGGMTSSAGDKIVDYRPWESREQNLKRGVKPEQMKF